MSSEEVFDPNGESLDRRDGGGSQALTADQARKLTDEAKAGARALWAKLVLLHDGGAHIALGYSSWGAYVEAEFDTSRWQGYELLRAGRVYDVLVGELPTGSPMPTSHRQYRELAPLLDDPETLAKAWEETLEEHPRPTADDVREVADRHRDIEHASSPGSDVDPLADGQAQAASSDTGSRATRPASDEDVQKYIDRGFDRFGIMAVHWAVAEATLRSQELAQLDRELEP